MSENRFDQHIYDEMSQLRIKPGAHVWSQVQASMRRKRRRRVIGFVLPVFLLTLAGTLWWVLPSTDSVQNPHSSTQIIANDQNSTLKDAQQQEIKNRTETLPENRYQPATEKLVTAPSMVIAQQKTLPVAEKEKVEKQTEKTTGNRETLPVVTDEYTYSGQSPASIALKSAVVAIDTAVTTAGKVREAEKHVAETIETNINEQEETQEVAIAESSETKLIDTVSEVIVAALDKDSVLPTTKEKEPFKGKWSFGIGGSYGQSGIGQGSFSNSIFKSSMVYNSSPGPATANYSLDKNELNHQAQQYYQAGIWANKSLTPRLSIQTGLDYQYYSTKTNVGWRVIEERFIVNTPASVQSAPVEYFYAPGTRYTNDFEQTFRAMAMPIESEEFYNFFHFISVPLQINYLLTPVKANYGVSLAAGIRYQRLLAEEILHFDEQNGVMFRLEEIVNKNQMTVTGGLNFELFRNNKFPIYITPNVGYQINNFYKPDPKTKHHAWVGALSVSMKLF